MKKPVLAFLVILSLSFFFCSRSGSNTPPVVDPAGDVSAAPGSVIIFKGVFSDPDENDEHTFKWDFGDGSTGGDKNALHIYRKTGKYRVIFEVTDKAGAIGTTGFYVAVRQDRPSAAAE